MIRMGKKFVFSGVALLLSSGALWAGFQAMTSTPPPALSAWAPQGSLLAIEAKDFSSLLKDWSGSEQQRAWLASDNYAGFSRSRLFSRLGEAQQQFAESAGLSPDMNFLNQVAGKESLFAWYDIGNLEFLYITHLPANSAEQTTLFQERSKFEARKAGAETFYLRSTAGADGGGQIRTVAFATHGDFLLLATREDLIANALLLMQGQANLDLQEEHWYAASTAAASGTAGDLRMTLNLAAIVPSPYFRSYWVQQNITEMKQYAAAETDLYRTPESFREERVLLPKSPEQLAAIDVAPVLEFLPPAAGVYRATANPATDQIVAALGEKLLFRNIASFRDSRVAPVADVSPQSVGSATDLETRIDLPPPPTQPLNVALAPLHMVLDAARVDAMLVTSSTTDGATGGASSADASDDVFLPFHSTVVLSASAPWSAETLQAALTEALRSRLTAGDNGLRWQSRSLGKLAWFELQGLQPLAFAVQGKVCVLASNSETLLKSLAPGAGAKAPDEIVTVAAGFNHTAERGHFARITALLDRQSLRQRLSGQRSSGQSLSADQGVQADQGETDSNESPENGEPGFFAKNIRSLSDTFQALESETFVERPDLKMNVVRQTLVYQWKH
jgi:hypothetical protein